MKERLQKIAIPIMFFSLLLNVLFVFFYLQEQNRNKHELADAVDQIILNIDGAADQLSVIDESQPDYENHIIAALRDIGRSESLIRAHETDMPQNLVSWIGGIEHGLANGAYHGIDEDGFQSSVKDIMNFKKGYFNEAKSIDTNGDPNQSLEIMEDVLSNENYMGSNYVKK